MNRPGTIAPNGCIYAANGRALIANGRVAIRAEELDKAKAHGWAFIQTEPGGLVLVQRFGHTPPAPHSTQPPSSEAKAMANKLSDRVAMAEGPSRELDQEIAIAVRNADRNPDTARIIGVANCSPYSASLDAAMTLVPERSWVRMDTWPNDFRATSASVCPLDEDADNPAYSAKAATITLALCAAALRARGL